MAKGNRNRWFLREWRKHRGLTQEKLAERTGLSKPFISQLETGKRQYMQDVLELLANALRCEPGDLIVRDPSLPEPIWSIWDEIPPVERPKAIAVLRAMRGDNTGTDD